MRKGLHQVVLWLLLVLLISVLNTGCSNDNVKEEKQLKKGEVEKFSQTFESNEIINLDSMKMRVINISLVNNNDPSEKEMVGKVAMGIEIGNISDVEVIFNPEASEIILSKDKTRTPDLTFTSSLGGSYPPKRVLQGFLTFQLTKDELNSIKEIKELKLKIPLPTNEKNDTTNDYKEATIPLGQLKSSN